MAWLAIDKNNDEYIYSEQPIRYKGCWDMNYSENGYPIGSMISLPNGTIKKLIGRELTWEDEAVEI